MYNIFIYGTPNLLGQPKRSFNSDDVPCHHEAVCLNVRRPNVTYPEGLHSALTVNSMKALHKALPLIFLQQFDKEFWQIAWLSTL